MTEQWDGVPENPERDGWHWLGTANDPVALFWKAAPHLLGGGTWFSGTRGVSVWAYLGPCLTPAEITAREAASAEAMREALYSEAIHIADALQDNGQTSCAAGAERVRLMIGRATIPHADAFSRALAAAERRGMEKAAVIARRVEIPGDCSAAEAHGRMTAALAAAEAIRNAAAQESEGC